MALSALDDKDLVPTPGGVEGVLGPAIGAWRHLNTTIADAYAPVSESWNFAGAKYGWILRLKRKKRTLLYLTPQEGRFLVGMILGDRALGVLDRGGLSPTVLELIEAAPRYAEGTGFRIPVADVADCDAIETILRAKMS